MKQLHRFGAVAFVITMLLVLMSGCTALPGSAPAAAGNTGTVTSALTQEQATAIAENALQAYNSGDYAAWSRDWTDTMKNAIQEKDFLAFRDELMASRGQYQSIASIALAPGQNKGYVRWIVVANFEKGQVRFGFGFKENGTQIEGVFPETI